MLRALSAPDFLRVDSSTQFDAKVEWGGSPAYWWIVPDIAPPTGPFLYAYDDLTQSPQVFKAFSFPGVTGWVQQNFYNITYAKPPASTWALPRDCLVSNLPNCDVMTTRGQP